MPDKRPLPPEMLDQIAAVFRALGEPSRLAILQTLMPGPRNVSDLAEAAGLSQANTSKHLAALAAAGLVSRTPQGTQAVYSIADPLVFKLCDTVCGSIRRSLGRSIRSQQRLLEAVRN